MSIREGDDILNAFKEIWKKSFKPKTLYKNSKGGYSIHWSLSCYLSEWLFQKYHVWFEYPVSPEKDKIKLDAAIWFKEKGNLDDVMDFAVEWEWGKGYNDKYNEKFTSGDFVKLLKVRAKAGIAIIGTYFDGKRKDMIEKRRKQSEKFLENIGKSNAKNNRYNRPIGVIEVRRVNTFEYECWYYNLNKDKVNSKEKLNSFSCSGDKFVSHQEIKGH